MRFRIFFAHVILYDRGSQTMGQEWRACQLLLFHVLPPTTGVGQGSTWCPRYSLPVWFPEVASIQFPIAGSAIQIYIYFCEIIDRDLWFLRDIPYLFNKKVMFIISDLSHPARAFTSILEVWKRQLTCGFATFFYRFRKAKCIVNRLIIPFNFWISLYFFINMKSQNTQTCMLDNWFVG